MKTKICSKCKIEKPLSEFHKDKSRKDGHISICKMCIKLTIAKNNKQRKIYFQQYRLANKKKLSEFYKLYRERNKDKLKQKHQEKKKNSPWKLVLSWIKQRCNNPNTVYYYRYGGRGIKCLITEEELKQLWFRDKAYLMKKPSIDRIDNDGHYELSNCRFIELSENNSKRNIDNAIKILQFDLNGKFIRQFESIYMVSKHLNIPHSTLCKKLQKGKFQYKDMIYDYRNELRKQREV